MHSIQATNKLDEYVHYAEGLVFDNHGLGSRMTTRRVIEVIKKLNPDVIHLHCIHGYYLNYRLLFDYLNHTSIPVVWTFHDCWAFTGHCTHFESERCEKWKDEGCHNCPLKSSYPKSFFDYSRRNYELKKRLFSTNNNLHIVAVSEWLASYTRESFLAVKDIRVINNGVDLALFRPYGKKNTYKYTILGVASAWGEKKGLNDFYRLREDLSNEDYEIVLVGLTTKQVEQLPVGIHGIARTNSVKELAELYSKANVFVNPTYADSFPTVNMEALACGTPVITYKTGGSPEIVDDKTGVVVNKGDIKGLVEAIRSLKEHPLSVQDCRLRAIERYDKKKKFLDYLNLYDSLL